ncbi:MAG: peptide deformylase [Candidatus Dormibacteraeota bacterium]|uniref:Peptide deformylase n=2 Tax=Candidatus Nephthysia bennettiae TaxID=3127016 RepID=A0A934K6G5_9BACT|nr:peptide deformylase [Candidatus Dormibacteraeota bacterium]
MASIGIRQSGDPILHAVCDSFRLPDEAEEAQAVINQLLTTATKAKELHPFSKGIGLAAPQIGLPRAVAIAWMPQLEPLILLNPRTVDESIERDEQLEGCLSFFDVRGLVTRPLTIRVESSSLDGTVRQIVLDQGTARLAAHEIDHLRGRLYVDRMSRDDDLVDVSRYDGSGSPWMY